MEEQPPAKPQEYNMFAVLTNRPTVVSIAALVLFAVIFFIGLAMGSAVVMASPIFIALAIVAGAAIWTGLSQ